MREAKFEEIPVINYPKLMKTIEIQNSRKIINPKLEK